jgi:plasmid maintenance system antidote protein VapI
VRHYTRRNIIMRRRLGWKMTEIARYYGIKYAAVRAICNGEK